MEEKKEKKEKKRSRLWAIVIVAVFLAILPVSCAAGHELPVDLSTSGVLGSAPLTQKAEEISDREFGDTSSLMILLKDTNAADAEEFSESLAKIEGVHSVSFDPKSDNCFKDGNALFEVKIDGKGDSETAEHVLTEAERLTESRSVTMSGAPVESRRLKKALNTVMLWLPIISLAAVIIITLFTSGSWIEPLLLAASASAAVVINLATNVFFGPLSFITFGASNILLLVYSVTYSMILLHSFNKMHTNEDDVSTSIRLAAKNILKPLLAGVLTTAAGMFALCFTQFSLGLELGLVMLKGMLISAVVSATFLPALLVLFDGALQKKRKNDTAQKETFLAKLAARGCFIIVPLTVIAVVIAGFMQPLNILLFDRQDNISSEITEIFGRTDKVNVFYQKGESNEYDIQRETEFIDKMSQITKKDGSPVLKDFTWGINTEKESLGEISPAEAAELLGLSESEAEFIYALYYLENNKNAVEMNTSDFVEFTCKALSGCDENSEFSDNEALAFFEKLAAIKKLLSSSNSSKEFYDQIKFIGGNELKADKFMVDQLYGMFYYGKLTNAKAEKAALLKYLSTNEISKILDSSNANALKNLAVKATEFDEQMKKPMTKELLKSYLNENCGMSADDDYMDDVFTEYFAENSLSPADTIPLIDAMTWLTSSGRITDSATVQKVNSDKLLYDELHTLCEFGDFPTALGSIAVKISVNKPIVTKEEAQQLFIMYFNAKNIIPKTPINGKDFVKFLLPVIDKNEFLSTHINKIDKAGLSDLLHVYGYITDTDKADPISQVSGLNGLHGLITSREIYADFTVDDVLGIYADFAMENSIIPDFTIDEDELLDFILEKAENNEIVGIIITAEIRERLEALLAPSASDDDWNLGENYTRLELWLDMPADEDEAAEIIEKIYGVIYEVFGENAYAVGEIFTTYEMNKISGVDSWLIALITVILVFIIITVTFRSISVPIILTFTVQGAVWITMLTQLFGRGMPFAAYIISTSLLLGGVVDHGIIMTANYLNNRRTMKKYEALNSTVRTSLPIVTASGLMLALCGFAMALISGESVMSSTGLILGIGSLVSLLLTLFTLPSMLYFFDVLIMGLTLQRRGSADEADTPDTSDMSDTPDTSDMSDMSDTPDTSDMSDTPDTSDNKEISGDGQTSEEIAKTE